MMITGIAHMATKVADMEAALDFYCGVLGFEKAFEIPNRQTGEPWIVYLKICKGSFLELFYGGVRDREQIVAPGEIGFRHWCVCVGEDSMPGLAQKFHRLGLLPEPLVQTGGDRNYRFTISDPEGNLIEFVAYNPDSPQMKSNLQVYPYERTGYTGIAHAAYGARSMEETLHFYSDILGMSHVMTRARDGKPYVTYLRVADGSYIELFPDGEKQIPRTGTTAGHDHLCLSVDDVPAFVEIIRAKGAPITVEPQVGSDRNIQAWTRDPDGNRIELMTLHPESPQALA